MFSKKSSSKDIKWGDLLKQIAKSGNFIKKYPIISSITIFSETLIFTLLLMQSNVELTQFQSVCSFLLGGESLGQTIFWLYNALTVISLFSTISIFLNPKSKNIQTSFIITYAVLQIFSMFYHVNAVQMFTINIEIYHLIFYLGFLTINIFLFYFEEQMHLFGVSSIAMTLAIPILPMNYWKVGLMIVIIRYYLTKQSFSKKLGSVLLLFVQVWAFCHETVSEQNSFQLIYFAFLAILIIYSCIYLKETFIPVDDQEYLMNLLKKSNNGSTKEIFIKIKDQIKIIQILESYGKVKMIDEENMMSLSFKVTEGKISREDLYELLNFILQDRSKKWLRAELEIIKNSNILKTFKLLSEINPEGLLQNIQLEKLIEKAEHNNRVILNHTIDMHLFQEASSQLEAFYQYSYASLSALTFFWISISETFLKEEQIISGFKKVITNHLKAKNSLEIINKIHFNFKESEIYSQIDKLINNYREEDLSQDKNQLNSISTSEKLFSYDYIVLSGGEVKEISSRLLIELGLQKEKKYLLAESTIFSPKMMKIILNEYEKYSKNEFYLPLQSKQNIIIKKATLHILPFQNNCVRYLFILKPCEVSKSLLYDSTNNYIINQTDKIKEEKTKRTDSSYVPIELFSQNLNSQNLSLMRKGVPLSCEINSFFACQDREQQERQSNIKINLHLLEQYRSEVDSILLIEAKFHHFSEVYSKRKSKAFSGTIEKSGSLNDETLRKNSNNQQFFCKIKNPYSENIMEKIENHTINKTINNSTWIVIIFSIIVLITVTMLIMIIVFQNKRQQEYTDYLEEGRHLQAQYLNIINLFYQSYFRTFTEKHQDKVLAFNSAINTTETVEYYTKSILKHIDEILQQEFQNPYQSLKPEINYTYYYSLYTSQATTIKPDILQILQGVKKSLKTFNLTFLINNYESIRSLQPVYSVNSIITKKIDYFHRSPSLLLATIIPPTALLTLLIYVLLLRGKQVMDKINTYLTKIDRKEYLISLTKIKRVGMKFPIIGYFDQMHKRKCSKMLYREIENERMRLVDTKKRIIENESRFTFVKNNSVYFLFLLSIIATCLIHIQYVNNECNNLLKTTTYLEQIQEKSTSILMTMTDAATSSVWKQIYNTTNVIGSSDNITLKTRLVIDDMPPFFDDIIDKANKALQQDLCKLDEYTKNIYLLTGVTCEKIYNGLLKKGYIIINSIYQNSLTDMKYYSFADLYDFIRPEGIYPVYLEAGYTRRVLVSMFTQMTQQFSQLSIQYSHYLQDQMQKSIYLALILYSFLVLIVAFAIIAFRKKCLLSLSLLRMIPKATIFDIKLTKDMIKTNFLGSLARL